MAWLVTDKCGDKWLFENKPFRDGDVWLCYRGATCGLDVFPFKDSLPSFVEQQQWKDAPLQVKIKIEKK